ncbi:hypothetical protein N7530_003260 [Penicillium desertorum]|uniref:Lysine-specific metallo-endopeptidase domain-containing protein n=1 Tax=Penicillium desertorum TaxID=1303715 RepID=A0A9W9WWV5_9EURO|nr:hypothetical protein N7530_003260 [Penicillium desertorum]
MVSTQVCTRYALLVLVACLALAITAVSQNVNTRFRIEQGTGAITRTVYREAIDMARAAVAAMDGYTSGATVRASLFTFFGIQEDESTHTLSAGSAARFSLVKADIEWLTWSPRFREYGPATVMCQGYTMASTTSQDRKLSITLCPRGQRTIAAGTNMAVALSSPATFLHELMHMTTRSIEDPKDGVTKKAYGPVLTGYLAQIEGGQKTVTNADNYGWFATAMYLNGVDWSPIIAEDGHGSWRTFLRGKAGNETIDTDGIDMDGDDCSTFPRDDIERVSDILKVSVPRLIPDHSKALQVINEHI